MATTRVRRRSTGWTHRTKVAGCAIVATIALAASRTAYAQTGRTTLRFGTMAPRNSPWGKILSVWAKALDQKTTGRVTMEVRWNGVDGPGPVTLQKVQTGRLEGTMVGLEAMASLYPDIYVAELPGVTRSWAELDLVRDVMLPRLDPVLRAAGLRFDGWVDQGRVRFLTSGFSAQLPNALANRPASTWFANDPVVAELLSLAGAAVKGPPVRRSAPPVFAPLMPAPFHGQQLLGTKPKATGEVLLATALGAERLGRFDHIDETVVWCGTAGVTLFNKSAIDALPPDVPALFNDISNLASKASKKRIRAEDDAAYERLTHTMTVVTHDARETASWNRLYADVVNRLAAGMLDKGAVNRVLAARNLPVVP